MADPLAGRSVALVLGPSTGGIGRHVRSLRDGLLRAGLQVRVCGPAATLARFAMTDAGGRGLCRVLLAADLVHAHGLRAGVLSAAVRSGGRPLVVTWHNAPAPGGPRRLLQALAARWLARRATVSLCVSADVGAWVRRLGGQDVRPAVVAAPRLAPVRDRTRARAGLGAVDRPLVVCVGRLHRQKAHDVLIDAAALLDRGGRGPLVAIAGEGPARRDLQRRAAATRAPVRLLGWRADVADLLGAADVVVLPSRWEGAPLALQEALRAGRPVVATDVGGVRELAGDAAVLVPPDDPAALAAAIGRLLEHPALAQDLAARASRAAKRLPGESDAVAQVGALYAELLGPGR